MEWKWKAEQADVPDLAMDCKDKGSDVQEEHSIHGLIRQAMEPPDMKHMRHRQRLHRTHRMSALHVLLSETSAGVAKPFMSVHGFQQVGQHNNHVQ